MFGRLRDQNDLGSIIDLMSGVVGLISSIFIVVFSVVLWNTGLVGGLRRYGEGVRPPGYSRNFSYSSKMSDFEIFYCDIDFSLSIICIFPALGKGTTEYDRPEYDSQNKDNDGKDGH
jgi:hypothetical protein